MVLIALGESAGTFLYGTALPHLGRVKSKAYVRRTIAGLAQARGLRRSAACCASTAARPRMPTASAPGRVPDRRRGQERSRARGLH